MSSLLEFHTENETGFRFDVVVFNFERIVSFLNNFEKIKNFRPDRDRLLILDCSINYESEKRSVAEFVQRHGWTLGKEIQIINRKNWGIDQGARVDYFSWLRKMRNRPRYVWQFQEHYLDLQSNWSIWPEDIPELGGQRKNDTLPDGLNIDLDLCEEIYEKNPSVGVIYADRAKLGIFTHNDGKESFYADGANFSVRAEDALEAFTQDILDSYKAAYDGTYHWALFLEFDLCCRLTNDGRDWHDLVTRKQFDSPAALRILEAEKQIPLHQSAEAFYGDLYSNYERRFNAALSESRVRRKLHTLASLWYVDLLASKSLQKLMNRIGLALVVKRMNHYIAGVLRHD